jgi:hypothetical protein
MELLIQPDQFIIQYPHSLMFVLLFSGLILFFISKNWRKRLKESGSYSFYPGVLFTVSFIFLIGGINLFVYKIVLNKDKIILFNIKEFNQQIAWADIKQVEYNENQQIDIFYIENEELQQQVHINLSKLDSDSMEKLKILINLKVKQNKNKNSNNMKSKQGRINNASN